MTKESNEANNTSVDHPILIWLVSVVCILIACLGAVMAVLNDQTVSELRSLKSEIARLEDDRNQLREELESDEFEQLRAIKSKTDDLLNKQMEYARLEAQYATLEAQIAEARSLENRIDNLNEDIQAEERIKKTLDNLKLDNKTKDQLIQDEIKLKAEKATLDGSVNDLKNQLKGVEARKADTQEQLDTLKAEVIEAQTNRNQAQLDQDAAERARDQALQDKVDAEKARDQALQDKVDAEKARDSARAEEGASETLRTGLEKLSRDREALQQDEARLKSRETAVTEQLNKINKQVNEYKIFTESMQNAFAKINEFNNKTAEQLEAVELDPPQINLDKANERLQRAWNDLLDTFVNDLIQNMQKDLKERTPPPVAPNEGTEDNTEEGN